MKIHERIKEIRLDQGLSQNKFGERLGVTRDMLSNIEYNRVAPKPIFINHLCETFNVNRDWLMTGEGEMYNTKDKDEEFLYLVKALNAENDDYKKRIIKLMLKLKKDEDWYLVESLVKRLAEGDELL
ncbi:helix-turn-helix domain-containing protein [Turicibacter sanguinis]|uniref:helix-turn-helix domain-containing protein n=1 Tax=Turicibacter sanguinis TaxID=154288 RepID=UPI00399541C7